MRLSIMFTVSAALALSLAGTGTKAFARTDGHNVVRKVDVRTVEVPATTRYVFDRTVGPGRIVRTGTGEAGLTKVTRTLFYVDGKLAKERTDTTVVRKPGDVVVAMSTTGYAKSSRSGSFVAKKVLTMNSSAYIANEGSMNPTAHTATGARCEFGIVAVDPRVIPLHSLVYVEGYGFGVAEDTGGSIKGNKIDLCMDSRSAMNSWGRRSVKVHVLRTLTDAELNEVGYKEGVSERIHDDSLVALAVDPDAPTTPSSALPATEQQSTGDPASTPGRDPKEPSNNTGTKPTPLPTPAEPASTETKTVQVTKDVNVRARASGDSSIVALLMKGDKVQVGAGSNGWYAVVTPSGTRGFVRGDSIGMQAPDAEEFPSDTSKPTVDTTPPAGKSSTMTLKRDDVIVRSKPSTEGRKVTKLPEGTKLTVTSKEDGWYKVKLKDGSTGYIREDMFDGEASSSRKSSESDSPKKNNRKSFDETKKSSKNEPKSKKSGDSDSKSTKKKKSSSDDSDSKKSSKKKSSDHEKSSKKSSSSEKKKSSTKSSSKKKEESSSKKKSSKKKG